MAEVERFGLARDLFGKKITLGSFPHVAASLLQLLDSMVPPASLWNNTAPIIRQNLAWALNGYQRLWKIIIHWIQTTGPSNFQYKSQLSIRFLTCTQRCHDAYSSLGRIVSLDIKVTCVWLRSLADLLSLELFRQEPALQAAFCQFVDSIGELAQQSTVIKACIEDILLPTLWDIKSDDILFGTFQSSFQAS